MKHPDSPKSLTRRTLLQAGLGAGGLLATPLTVFAAAPPGFDQWRDSFRARALAKGISAATWTRVMARIEPDMSVFRQMRKQPEFHEQIWQYINRRVSDWRIINGARSAEEERSAVRADRAGFRRRARHAAGAVGRRVGLWRSAGAAEPHAPGVSLARRARLERAAPKSLLGDRADQRAAHRRPRLEHAGGNAGILGRRDGTFAMDAGSLAQCRHRL